MIYDKTVLAIIPARGGSKGVPKKNIINVAGKPLINWTIDHARESKIIDRLILSSDSQEIINIANLNGCEVPFKRPVHLATDTASAIDVIHHAVDNMPYYDYVVILQPTSPLRTTKDIDDAIISCTSNNANSCVSVCKVNKSPYLMYSINKNNRLKSLLKYSGKTINRQEYPATYMLNGAIYIIKSSWFLGKSYIIDEDTLPYIMPESCSLDIDSELDVMLANLILSKKNN